MELVAQKQLRTGKSPRTLPSTCASSPIRRSRRVTRLRFVRRPALDLRVRCCQRSTCWSRCKRSFPLSSSEASPRRVQRPSVELVYRPPHDFSRISRRVLILPGCLALEQHVHLRFRWHAVQKGLRLSCRDRARADAQPLTHRAWEVSQVRTPSLPHIGDQCRMIAGGLGSLLGILQKPIFKTRGNFEFIIGHGLLPFL